MVRAADGRFGAPVKKNRPPFRFLNKTGPVTSVYKQSERLRVAERIRLGLKRLICTIDK
jgi:hypothetical protein